MATWYEKAQECLDKDYAEGLLTDKEYSFALYDLRDEYQEQLDWEREQRMDEYCGY